MRRVKNLRTLFIVVVPLLLVVLSCSDEELIAPVRNNALDIGNPDLGGLPFNLQAEVDTASINLTWNEINHDAIDTYNIYRQVSGDGDFAYKGNAVNSNWSDIEVDPGTVYSYKISAVARLDSAGGTPEESDWEGQEAVSTQSMANFNINGGNLYTDNSTVTLNVEAADVDSLWIWNDRESNSESGQAYTWSGGEWSEDAWELSFGEGPRSVLAWLWYEHTGYKQTVSSSIIVDRSPPNVAPVLSEPADEETEIQYPRSHLYWSEAEDEWCDDLMYRVMLDINSPPANVIADSLSAITVQASGLLPSTYYYWQVVAVDATGHETPSEIWSFLTTAVPAEFAVIQPGIFLMGSPTDELDGLDVGDNDRDDEDQHSVELTNGFYMSAFEVTNLRYQQQLTWALDQGHIVVSGAWVRDARGSGQNLLMLGAQRADIRFNNGSFTLANPDNPVVNVTWYGAAAYCNWISEREGFELAYDHSTWECNEGDPYNAEGYRLPTEAEWEYACRAGTTTAFYSGPITVGQCGDPALENVAFYCKHRDLDWTSPVGGDLGMERIPNAFELYDMHGNVWEFCNDWYASSLGFDPVIDPIGPATGDYRVAHGGCWQHLAVTCRSADRSNYQPENYGDVIGFRPVRSIDD